MNLQPLPRRPVRRPDELLSSWIIRLAKANHCSVVELCGYLGLGRDQPPETHQELASADIARFCAIARLSPDELNDMVLVRQHDFPIECISYENFQQCPTCTNTDPGLALRHWRLAWSMECEACGSELLPVWKTSEDDVQISAALSRRAHLGARRLKFAYCHLNRRLSRRVGLAADVLGVMAPQFKRYALFSHSRVQRYSTLASLYLGTTRPFLFAAIALRNDWSAVTRLGAAYPHRKKMLERLVGLAEMPPAQKMKKKDVLSSGAFGCRFPTSSNPVFLSAAKDAIEQLGEGADPRELLLLADEVIKRRRLAPVDIS
ncbi:TniQ family protein [Cognatiyoonia sp. IB215182]|uniref:TniQ family protein n=1 Tax=Cognatiyoonia sp. IB215182 TaxID=3097353 RepID=UPI002A143B3C|nr:TniQ family protein [Cognatiyoonia sp. IB215182]MDX8354839.1 TniQ family protein [Cognatiyoonia sp. IB215182]